MKPPIGVQRKMSEQSASPSIVYKTPDEAESYSIPGHVRALIVDSSSAKLTATLPRLEEWIGELIYIENMAGTNGCDVVDNDESWDWTDFSSATTLDAAKDFILLYNTGFRIINIANAGDQVA